MTNETSISLSQQEWQYVVNTLVLRPFTEVADLLAKIRGQFEAANTPAAAPPKEE